MNTNKDKIYPAIRPFNDHPNCKGHANAMLDQTYETKEERDLMVKVLDNYIQK